MMLPRRSCPLPRPGRRRLLYATATGTHARASWNRSRNGSLLSSSPRVPDDSIVSLTSTRRPDRSLASRIFLLAADHFARPWSGLGDWPGRVAIVHGAGDAARGPRDPEGRGSRAWEPCRGVRVRAGLDGTGLSCRKGFSCPMDSLVGKGEGGMESKLQTAGCGHSYCLLGGLRTAGEGGAWRWSLFRFDHSLLSSASSSA